MHDQLSRDLVVNVTFGLFMAVLALAGLYQAARYTARWQVVSGVIDERALHELEDTQVDGVDVAGGDALQNRA